MLLQLRLRRSLPRPLGAQRLHHPLELILELGVVVLPAKLTHVLIFQEGFEKAEHLGAAGGEQGRDILAFRGDRRVRPVAHSAAPPSPTNRKQLIQTQIDCAVRDPDYTLYASPMTTGDGLPRDTNL